MDIGKTDSIQNLNISRIFRFLLNKYLLGFLATIVIYYPFQLFYFNRFVPIQDGWFIEYAKQWNSGKIIYKDFHVFIQPVYVFIFGWLSNLFGYSLIVFRYYGLVERFLLIAVVFALFALITRPYRAAFLTLLGLFFFTANTADVIYSYYQLVAVFCFTSVYCLIWYYKNDSILAIFLAGIFSGLAFMTKQSTGVLLLVAFLFMMIVLDCRCRGLEKRMFLPKLLFVAGIIAPILIILAYLVSQGSLAQYWAQVFGGAGSKGKLSHILFGFWHHLLSTKAMAITGTMFLVLYFVNRVYARRESAHDSAAKLYLPIAGLVLLAGASMIAYLLQLHHPRFFNKVNDVYISICFFENRNKLVFLAFLFNAVLVCFYFGKAIVGKLTREDIPRTVIVVASFAFMYGHGLSGFIEPHAAILAMGLMFLWFLEIKTPFVKLRNAAVYLSIVFLVAMHAFEKNSWMYSWWGWDERTVWTATKQPETQLLKGFRLNQDKAEILNGITKLIQQYSSPRDTIYTFPHMPIFYLLADRNHATFSAVHYFDVCPDTLAISDSRIVALTLPNVIVVMHFPEDIWKVHEDIFRGGRHSGQRDIKEVLDRFVTEGKYISVKTYITSGYNYKIEVLVRNKGS